MFNNLLINFNRFKLVKESFIFCWLYLEISLYDVILWAALINVKIKRRFGLLNNQVASILLFHS